MIHDYPAGDDDRRERSPSAPTLAADGSAANRPPARWPMPIAAVDAHPAWLLTDTRTRTRDGAATGSAFAGPDTTAAARVSHRTVPPRKRGPAVSLPILPPGARPLTADEAVELLVVGEHRESGSGTIALDSALIEGLRGGLIMACQLSDGRIAFIRPSASLDQ